MSRKKENQGFICHNCGEKVLALENGSFRNHCPHCLFSVHLDDMPGDRSSSCKGLMMPKGVKASSKKGLQIIHRCMICGIEKVNKVAEDMNQGDNVDVLIKLF